MHRITITLTDSARMNHVPLAALGYAYRRAQLLAPLTEIALPMKTLLHSPNEKLTEALVLILAGGRATAQIDLLLRPNLGLAQAWGQAQFAQQSTVADTLDRMTTESLGDLQQGFTTWMQCWSQTCCHDFRHGRMIWDGDLTGLPASRRAEGSRKGYFAGKKIVPGGNWRGLRPVRMAKRWGRSSMLARKPALNP